MRVRRNLMAFFLLTCALTGCASMVSKNISSGLEYFIGRPIDSAVQVRGYPDGKREILGHTLYIWSSNHSATLAVPTMSTTTGVAGSIPVYGTTTSVMPIYGSFYCTITLAVDAKDTIVNWQWTGNLGGCEQYAKILKGLKRQIPATVARSANKKNS